MPKAAPAPSSLRNRALKAYIFLYLCPLTLLFAFMVCVFLPFGSLIMAFLYAPPLAALWSTAISWKNMPPDSPPFQSRSLEARRAMMFLWMGLLTEVLALALPVRAGTDPMRVWINWLACAGLPAALFAVCAIWRQWREGDGKSLNGPAA